MNKEINEYEELAFLLCEEYLRKLKLEDVIAEVEKHLSDYLIDLQITLLEKENGIFQLLCPC